ncbi:uncharacterized protein C6orf136 homolog isoform X1 [Strigops habroptila]|uniref:uncharacterized protein C6orf136 homolog isoform X1 n=1 Tax=Strigops habroptila TaxID=2489341 RepID=UPI0011CF7BF8|nr:uncharacterized protein C6orf136 homolog isoform X1 [Strigops habroptila]
MGQLHPHVVVPSSYGAAPSPYGAAAPLWGSSILLWGSSIPMVQLHPPMGQILLYGAAPPLWGSSPSMGQLCPSMGSSIPLWGSSPSMGQLHPHCPTPARPPLSTGHPQDLDPPLGHVPALPPPAPRPPLALSPPEGLGGAITTVDGRREDDIAVRDGPGAAVLLLLRPPAPLLRPAGPPRRAPPTMEEHLAVMHQKLQDELPNFFLKIPDYGLYSHDVEFINHLLHLHTRGRPMYQVAVALCRALAWGYFASLRLEVLALTRHPEDWSIRARWRLTGLPLHLCVLRFYRRDKSTLLRGSSAATAWTS